MSIGITMIGTSGTGKTCYLYAMTAQMVKGNNGFSFVATEYDKGLELASAWRGIVGGEWPRGTVESLDYEFSCAYAYRELMKFTWHDYRGNIIIEKKTDDRDVLFEKMHTSSALIICVAADVLQGTIRGDACCESDIDTYARVLAEYRNNNGSAIPVVLVITKADLLSEGEFDKGVELLKERAFSPLLAPDDDGGWFIMFTPVSLGSFGNKNETSVFHIDPVNTHIPVMFAVHCTLSETLSQLKSDLGVLNVNITSTEYSLRIEKNRNVLGRWWNSNTRGYLEREIKKTTKDHESLTLKIEKIEQDLAKIAKEILKGPSHVYLNGEKMGL